MDQEALVVAQVIKVLVEAALEKVAAPLQGPVTLTNL
jgi:hypothetical protein